MAQIRPFRGVRYNSRQVKNLAQVICPPYDIISPQLQEELYWRDEYNFVRIEYNQETPRDNAVENRYTRSAAFMELWLNQGVLEFEALPSIYYHQHYFICQGKSYKRNNLIAGLRLEEWDSRIVRPHENIIPRAKSDRLKTLETCQANTSPVLAMYEDKDQVINSVLSGVEKELPKTDLIDPWGDKHRMWCISDPEAISRIQGVISPQPLYIADGHHRYDSALTFRNQMAARSRSPTDDAGYNFVMTSLIDFADSGMVILPSHRLLRGIPEDVLRDLKSRLSLYFEIAEIDLDVPDFTQILDATLSGIKPDSRIIKFAICGLQPGRFLILTLRDLKSVARFMPQPHSEAYQKLDVSLVDHIILDGLLALDKDRQEGSLAYNHDRQEALDLVKNGEYQAAFLLNPIKPEMIRAIADAGDRMPRKSTYFYPKAPAGLVFYKW